jgi:DNA-binding transcriptional LysR family regulator
LTASYTRAAVEAGLLRRILPDHFCEPLGVHALLPARQFVPAKVRCFLEALESQAHIAVPRIRSTTVPVIDFAKSG